MTENKHHWYDGWFYDFVIAPNQDKLFGQIKSLIKPQSTIVGDYLVPRPKGFGSCVSEAIEFIAGREHYRNFKNYVTDGGIYYLADKAGLKVIEEITNHPLSNHIVILTK